MNNEVTNIEECLEREMKINFINNYANLVADNVSTYFKYYGNNSHTPLQNIKRMSMDEFTLNIEEENILNDLIKQRLETKYKLKLISSYEDVELILERLK